MDLTSTSLGIRTPEFTTPFQSSCGRCNPSVGGGKKNKSGSLLPTHTIRFWEKEFKQIKPKILRGNRRYYDKKNIDLLKKIKFLLKDQGMTINGVKKLLKSKQKDKNRIYKC